MGLRTGGVMNTDNAIYLVIFVIGVFLGMTIGYSLGFNAAVSAGLKFLEIHGVNFGMDMDALQIIIDQYKARLGL